MPLSPAFVSLETPSASSGEARARAVFKDCPALELAAERERNSLPAKACLGLLLPLLLSAYGASSPVVFLEGPFTATSVRVEARKDGSPGMARSGHLPWWQWAVALPHPGLGLFS